MMVTLSRLFPDAAGARAVVDELKAAGLPEDDIGIIAPSRSIAMENSDMENADMENAADQIDRDRDGHDDRGATVNKSAGIGAALGGAAGLLAGLGAFVLPGIGTVIAAGWLASTLAGAVAGGAAGGVVGALIEAGVSENDAAGYAEGVRRGGTLVTIRVMARDREFYEDVLTQRAARRVRGGVDPAGIAVHPNELNAPHSHGRK